MDYLTKTLAKSRLDAEQEQLLFNPPADSGISQEALQDIPRYLFRVATPHSDGKTNGMWVRSEATCQGQSSSTEDIFFRLDTEKRGRVARTLNKHLRWWPKDGIEDNFVSWTSSLLFAIQYIYYRHISTRDRSRLEDIKLYVIDTTLFLKGTFLRDLDLIRAFSNFDIHSGVKNLENFLGLRTKKDYYFGEFLSQGSLKIENKCQVFSAKTLFVNGRLQRLQPHFAEIHDIELKNGKVSWVNEVIRVRQVVWPLDNVRHLLCSTEMRSCLEVVDEILSSTTPNWKYPLAVYFAALIGSEAATEDQEKMNDNIFFLYFRNRFMQDSETYREFTPSSFKTYASDTMPELKQVEKYAQELYVHCTLKYALDHIREAEVIIRSVHFQNVFFSERTPLSTTISNEALVRLGRALVGKLGTVQMLCERVVPTVPENEL